MEIKLALILPWLLITSAITDAGGFIHPGMTEKEIMVGGLSRRFIVYLPHSYNANARSSVIFLFHGGGGTPRSMLMISDNDDFRTLSEKNNIILVAPEGIKKSWNDGRETKADKLNIDDVEFVKVLLGYIVKNYSVDTTRIYATGISNGGFMVSRLACEMGDRFAAVAVVAATLGEQMANTGCHPAAPLPVMYIHGTADPLVRFEGGTETIGAGGAYISHQQVIDKWVSIDKCSPVPVVKNLPDISDDGTTVTERVYRGNTDRAVVVSYIIKNGGHTWPGGKQYLPKKYIGVVCRDIDGCQVIWDFFRMHKSAIPSGSDGNH